MAAKRFAANRQRWHLGTVISFVISYHCELGLIIGQWQVRTPKEMRLQGLASCCQSIGVDY